MKILNTENWDKNFRHDGLLYFAQRIEEMTFNYTSELYKAPVLNTYLLVREYLDTAKLVSEKIIKENHLKYIMSEFQYSFNNDIIVENFINAELRTAILQKLNSSSQSEQLETMKYIHNILGNYNDWCINYLKKIVPQEKEKKKIERALKCFIPGLIGAGYSKEYIYFYSKKIFFDNYVTSLDVLHYFLDRFDFNNKKYDVFIAINKRSLKFKELLEKRLHVSFENKDNEFKFNDKKYCLIKLEIEALDERGAARKAYRKVNLFFKYYHFLYNKKGNFINNRGKVVDEEGNISFVDLNDNNLYSVEMCESRHTGNLADSIISGLLYEDNKSFSIINRVIDIHNFAIMERNLNNGFLNLWSILEILFVLNQEDTKLAEIEKSILPILQNDYLDGLFSILKNNILENLSEIDIKEIIKDLSGSDFWIQRLIILPENNEIRKKLISKLSEYPLLRTRICTLNELFSKKSTILADLERYTQRIKWHLARLYRTRNTIIHDGVAPRKLKELGEHLHSYVDECILEIAVVLSRDNNLHTIEDVIINTQIINELTMKQLRKKGDIVAEDIVNIFTH